MTISTVGRRVKALVLASCLGFLSLPAIVTGEIATFNFAPVGTSFSAFLAPDSPLVGKEIVSARIYLDVESFPGSDAADFFTDISFPIQPLPGNESALVLFGADLNWSGAGLFHFFEETTQFNGVFVPARYGGETGGEFFDGALIAGSRIEFDYIVPEPKTILLLALGVVMLLRRWRAPLSSVARAARSQPSIRPTRPSSRLRFRRRPTCRL